MFKVPTRKRTGWTAAYEMAGLTYHMTVRAAGGAKANPLFSLIMNIVQIASFIVIMYYMMTLLRFTPSALRGDFVLFIMSGVMAYITYFKAMKAVSGSDGPISPMMLHAPMNTIVAIASSALSALYLQVISTTVILAVYHLAFRPVTIDEPAFTCFMMIAAWMSGVATGLVLMSLRPWAPKLAPLLQSILIRINVIFSGKMVLGNTMSFTTLKLFDWNPLFHCIDQMRGAIFLNYNPRNSEVAYIFEVSAALIALGLMLEFFTRRRISQSWFAR